MATAACLPTVFVAVLAIGSLALPLCRGGNRFGSRGLLMGVFCLAIPLPYNLASG